MTVSIYALRCDFDVGVDIGPLSDWLSANADSWLVCFEEVAGENPHVHACIYSTKDIGTLRKSFKRKFEAKRGNGAYSLKLTTGSVEDYEAYICKGEDAYTLPTVITSQGLAYSNERVEQLHQQYWDENARRRKAGQARAAAKGVSMLERVEQLCREQGVMSYDRKGIARVYIREAKRLRKPINIFAARAVVNGVVVALDEDLSGAAEDIVTSIANL